MLGATKRLISTLEKQIADEREMHSRELGRVLSENKRLQDECERLRLALGQPSRVAELPPEPKPPADPDEMPAFTGTPWNRVQQREAWLDSPAGKRWTARQLGSLKELTAATVAEVSGETEKTKEIH